MDKVPLIKTIGQEKTILLALFFFNTLLLFFCTKLSPLYNSNFWSDVNIYFSMGKGIMNGLVPFRDIFDHKGPVIFFIYGLGYLISNDTFLGIYIIEVFFYFLGTSAIYLLSRHYLNKFYSFITALCFVLVVLLYNGLGGAAEDFILMLQAVGLLFFFKSFQNEHKPQYMLVQGFLVAFVFFIKLNLVVFWFFLLLAVLIDIVLKKKYKLLVRNIIYFILGLSLITVPLALYFIINASFSDLWNGYIIFNSLYSNVEFYSVFEFSKKAVVRFLKFAIHSPFFFGGSIVGVVWFLVDKSFVRNRIARIGLFLCFLSMSGIVFMSQVIMEYYYISFAVFPVFICIAIFYYLQKYLILSYNFIFYIPIFILALISGCFIKQFFEESTDVLIKRKTPQTVENVFSEIIKKEEDRSLVCLGIDRGLSVFTKADIIPTVKYFFYPNIYYDVYPVIRDNQTQYIKDKTINFIIIRENSLYYDYYTSLSEFQKNYRLKSTIVDEEKYFLYKRID